MLPLLLFLIVLNFGWTIASPIIDITPDLATNDEDSRTALSTMAIDNPRFLQEDDINNGTTIEPADCPACVCECSDPAASDGNNNSSHIANNEYTYNDDPTVRTVTLNLVALEARNIFSIVEASARDFEIYKANKVEEELAKRRRESGTTSNVQDDPLPTKVKINVSPSVDMPSMYNDIINDAKSGGGIFEGYFTNPVILGTVATLNNPGLLDLTPYVANTDEFALEVDLDWTDVLLPFRKYVAQFEGKIYMLPLDGDIHSMYVRKDVLQHFGLDIPRTWEEYNAVAKALHGQVYNNITLSGSCVSRVIGSHGQYWSHLILSSMTQTNGPSTGSLFDTKDMSPLTGEAFTETLRILEEQSLYGVPTGK